MKIKAFIFTNETPLSAKQVFAGWLVVFGVMLAVAAMFSPGALMVAMLLIFLLSACYFGITSESNHDPFEVHDSER